MLVEVKVQSLGLDTATNDPLVILQECGGERVLPIWIGPSEARAIAMRMADMEFTRPLTHDLLASVLRGLGGALRKVVITRVENSTYFAELIVQRNGEVIAMDARPSDSIAIALRLGATIYAHEELLDLASIEIAETPDVSACDSSGAEPSEPESHSLGAEELKEYLRRLNPEDFGRFTP